LCCTQAVIEHNNVAISKNSNLEKKSKILLNLPIVLELVQESSFQTLSLILTGDCFSNVISDETF
jgi:hypothetical protein